MYERVPHITLKSIANNTEIDVIYEGMQPDVEGALADLNSALQGHAEPFKVEMGGRKGESIDFTAAKDATVTLPSGESAPANGFLEWEIPRKPERGLERGGPRRTQPLLGGPHRPPARNRCLHRRPRRVRDSLRQTL